MANPTDCRGQPCYIRPCFGGLSLVKPDDGTSRIGLGEQDKMELTGPIMVACQWNYSNPRSQHVIFHTFLKPARWSRAHRHRYDVLGSRLARGGRTKSSPIGPAEHDDGGSLSSRGNISRCSCLSLEPDDGVFDGFAWDPACAAAPPPAC